MKPHLSVTQISMIALCAKRYEFRYIEGIKSPPGVALVLGKGGHQAVEADLRAKMATGSLLAAEDVAQRAAEAVRAEWEKEPPDLSEEEREEGAAKVLGRTVDSAVSLAGLHHREAAPEIQPTAVEAGFRLELDGFPFDIIGFKDVEEANRIRDTKFKGKSPPADAADKSMQLTLYHLESATRGLDVEVQLDCLVANQRPKYVPLRSRRTTEDHARLLRRVEIATRQIQSGIFPPTDPTSWACSPRWCGYWDRCDFGGKQKVSAGLIDPKRLVSRVRAEEASVEDFDV